MAIYMRLCEVSDVIKMFNLGNIQRRAVRTVFLPNPVVPVGYVNSVKSAKLPGPVKLVELLIQRNELKEINYSPE